MNIFRRINLFRVLLVLSVICLSRLVSADFSPGTLPPVYDLLLSDTSSPLQNVLDAYSNPSSQHIFVAAHRGGKENDVADGAPGNSIANIDNALSNGFDLYESDIEILGDGTLVVFHDDTFDDLTNSTMVNDALGVATLAYAKTLLLTYDNDLVSDQKIPTLEEFLIAAKDKIMVKFDLKSGTFGSTTLQAIFDTVIATDSVEQVLIRGGANLLSVADTNGYDTQMIMRQYNSPPSVSDIQTLVMDYPNVRAISIPDGADIAVIEAANAAGLVVELHELQGVTAAQREAAWQQAIDDGYRQVHSFKPTLLLDYLKLNGNREF